MKTVSEKKQKLNLDSKILKILPSWFLTSKTFGPNIFPISYTESIQPWDDLFKKDFLPHQYTKGKIFYLTNLLEDQNKLKKIQKINPFRIFFNLNKLNNFSFPDLETIRFKISSIKKIKLNNKFIRKYHLLMETENYYNLNIPEGKWIDKKTIFQKNCNGFFGSVLFVSLASVEKACIKENLFVLYELKDLISIILDCLESKDFKALHNLSISKIPKGFLGLNFLKKDLIDPDEIVSQFSSNQFPDEINEKLFKTKKTIYNAILILESKLSYL